MNHYITGATIKKLREEKQMKQSELAESIRVSAKTISKWETMRGLPDISLIEPLAKTLGISVMELMTGDYVTNKNRTSNMLKTVWYVCPICGNIIHTTGECMISCCGITLPPLAPEECDENHSITVERVENDYYVTIPHEMEKTHYISFIAYVTARKAEIVKFYPEESAETRFFIQGHGKMYAYCNRHGLIYKKV